MQAGFLSLAVTVVLSALGIYNWMEFRDFVIGMLAAFKVNPFAWQAIDNMTFLLSGVIWLAYVFFCQFYIRKQALKRRWLPASVLLLAVQLWLLLVCRVLPALFGGAGRAFGIVLPLEGALAVLLTAYVLSARSRRRIANINQEERG